MSVTVKQSYEAKATSMFADGSYKSLEVSYVVMGVQDIENGENEALEAVRQSAPQVYYNLPLKYVEVDSRDNDSVYHVKAVYEKNSLSFGNDEQDEEATVSFDCGGGSRSIKTAYSQKRIIGTVSPGLSVGWNGKTGDDSEVAGVDVPTAQLRESYTKVMRLSRLTTKYKRKVAELVGCVNSKEFKGWDPGEVMFLGMSYSAPDKSSSRVTVTFNFMIQMNENMTLTGSVNGETQTIKYFKKGHQYIWSVTEERAEGTPVRPHVTLKGLFLADVCKYKDFGELGL